ncbi:PhoU domain-containing protein [Lentzea sp. NPDC051838]|uniref:phosphate signaling complex PhoU family protein n=1 Tax=Lentzea sp. NPDC051838 TaxID=3154849 RepID=UPI00342DB454
MRDHFHHRLDALVLHLAHMCDLTALAIHRATAALLSEDLALAEQVIADDVVLDTARERIEHDVHLLLALQSPVASDLRTIVQVARSAEKVERMGDLARHVAVAVRRRHPDPAVPPALRDLFVRRGDLAERSAQGMSRIVRTRDPLLLHGLTVANAEMNGLNRTLLDAIDREWPYGTVHGVDAVLLSRFYARFADQALAVARLVTGRYQLVRAS